MRILYIIESLRSGGKERRFVSLLEELAKNETIQIEVIILSEILHYKSIFDHGFNIHFLKRDFRKDFSIFTKFNQIVNSFGPDLVHCWDNIAAFHFGPICKLKKIPFVNSMISSAPKMNIFSKRYFFHIISFPFSDVVLSNSQAGLDSFFVPKRKQRVIYNGFNMNRTKNIKNKEDVQRIYKIDGNKPIIGMIASFTDHKDYETFIEAAKILEKDCYFIAIGDGPNLIKTKDKVLKLGLENVRFLGKISDVESIVNIFDIGILLSNPVHHAEGISNALLECMAFAKPIIASKGGGTDELVIDGETGYLIEPKNPIALTDKIKQLLFDLRMAKSMGIAGKKRLMEKFSLDKMIEDTVKLYKEVLS